jgi:hypothetical protein
VFVPPARAVHRPVAQVAPRMGTEATHVYLPRSVELFTIGSMVFTLAG